MDRQKLLLKIAQVATIEQVRGMKSITRLVLKDGVEVKISGSECGRGFAILDDDKKMQYYYYGDLQEARDKLARWENAPEWANELVLDENQNLFWCDVYYAPWMMVRKSTPAKGVFVGDGFGFEERPVIE